MVTEAKPIDPPDHVHRELLERVARGDPLPDLLHAVVAWIERHAQGALGTIFLMDTEQNCLRLGAAPSLPADFRRALERVPVHPAGGAWGAAASRRERVVIENLENHPWGTAYWKVARPHGLPACWAEPILSAGGELLGILNICHREARAPTEAEAGLLTTGAHLIAIAIDRKRANDGRREVEEYLRVIFERQQVLTGLSLQALAGSIAHDINNSAAAILGSADLALASLEPNHPAWSHLKEIGESARKSGRMAARLAEAGTALRPNRRTLSLQPILDEATRLLRILLPEEIQVRSSVGSGTPLVAADAVQVHQVIILLALQAIRLQRNRVHVLELKLEPVTLLARLRTAIPEVREGRYARLAIETDGIAPESSVFQELFDPLQGPSVNGASAGPALGVVQAILKAHHGGVRPETPQAGGFSLQLYFPVAETAAPAAPSLPPGEPALDASQKHILCVDDDEVIVYITTRALRRLGYRVTGFLNSTHALESFRSQPGDFDLVITDLSMPGLSGAEMVHEMRAIRSSVPVVLTSGCIRPEDVQTAQSLGAAELLPKPATVEEMGRVLRRLLQAPGSTPPSPDLSSEVRSGETPATRSAPLLDGPTGTGGSGNLP